MKQLITLYTNTANWHKRKTWVGLTGLERWSTGNCGRDDDLEMLTNNVDTNHDVEKKIHNISWDFDIQTDHSVQVRRWGSFN